MAQQAQGEPISEEKSPARARSFSPTFLALCFAFIMVRLPFMFTVPMQEAPDEFAHYWVIRFMRDHLRLPSASEVLAGGPSAVYGSLPQMGYLPHLAISLLTPPSELALYERYGSLLMGMVLLYAAYQIGREIFPRERLLAFALPAAIVFHPQLAFLHAYANSDSTATALGAVILLLAIRSVRQGLTVKTGVIIGLLMGWMALSKYSGLAVMPVVGMTLIAGAVINRTPVARAVMALTMCAMAATAVSGWWFVRNFYEFNGDFMGTQTMYRTWATTFNRELNYQVSAWSIIKEFRWWRMMFFSFWGLFGYMTKYLWRPVYFVFLGYFLVGALGAIRNGVIWTRSRIGAMTRADAATLTIWACMTLTVLLNLTAMIWASTKNLGGPQGRYLFPSEIPVMALLLLGMNRFGNRWSRVLVLSFIGFNAIVCLGSWLWLFQMYGFHNRPL
jgi:hypothetical protein